MVRVPLFPRNATDRRRRQIERELRALRLMESHLTTKEIWWAILTIPGVALLCLLLFAKLRLLSNSVPFAVAGALVAGLVVWWIGRRWFTVTFAIVIALICLVLGRRRTLSAPTPRPKRK